jgi:Protein of unknown function (DUF2442)
MTRVKVQNGFDEPVTQVVLSQAIERGRTRGGQGVHATTVKYLPILKSLLISFADHSAVALPVRNYPELAALSAADLGKLTLGLGGSALCLDARDLHVSIAGMVAASKPLMDMAVKPAQLNCRHRARMDKRVGDRAWRWRRYFIWHGLLPATPLRSSLMQRALAATNTCEVLQTQQQTANSAEGMS